MKTTQEEREVGKRRENTNTKAKKRENDIVANSKNINKEATGR